MRLAVMHEPKVGLMTCKEGRIEIYLVATLVMTGVSDQLNLRLFLVRRCVHAVLGQDVPDLPKY